MAVVLRRWRLHAENAGHYALQRERVDQRGRSTSRCKVADVKPVALRPWGGAAARRVEGNTPGETPSPPNCRRRTGPRREGRRAGYHLPDRRGGESACRRLRKLQSPFENGANPSTDSDRGRDKPTSYGATRFLGRLHTGGAGGPRVRLLLGFAAPGHVVPRGRERCTFSYPHTPANPARDLSLPSAGGGRWGLLGSAIG